MSASPSSPSSSSPTAADVSGATADAIAFTLNGEPMLTAAGTTLAALLDSLGHAPRAVATSVNGEFVARDARAACTLRAGDQVMTFQPIVGG